MNRLLTDVGKLCRKQPLILVSLAIFLVTDALMWFSGIYIGRGEEVLGLLLYVPVVILGVIDFIIYWLIFFGGDKDASRF